MIELDVIGGSVIHKNLIQEAVLPLEKSKHNYGAYQIKLSEQENISDQNITVYPVCNPEEAITLPLPIRLGSFVNAIKKKSLHAQQSKKLQDIVIGDFTLNQKTSIFKNNFIEKQVYLTEKECALIAYIYQSKEPVSRQDLLKAIWGYVDGVETHTLETHLYRLRQKIEAEFGQDDFIIMEDGGYILNIES